MTAPHRKDQIEAVRAACIKANPEIVELKFGCRAKDFLRGEFVVAGVQKYEGETDTYFQFYDKIPHPQFYQSPRGNWDIIGRPIRLADVFLAIRWHDLNVQSDGWTRASFASLGWSWNLRTDDLEQQSDETVAFISSLLTA